MICEVELLFEAMPIGPDQSLTLMVYPAVPGSPAESALRLLASWTMPSHSDRGRPAPHGRSLDIDTAEPGTTR